MDTTKKKILRGRPKKVWLNGVEEAHIKLVVNLDLVLDKDRWRNIIMVVKTFKK